MNILFILSIFLFPFQIFSISLFTSKYDLTSFLLLFLTFYYSLKHRRINYKLLLFFYFFSLVQILIFFYFSSTPVYRFISSFVWLGGLILVMFTAPKISFDKLYISKMIIILSIFTSVVIIIQFNFLNIARPKAFFLEPSTAGLMIYSVITAIVSILIIFKNKFNLKLKTVFVLIPLAYAAYLTKSMHIVTFIIVVSFVLFVNILNSSKYFFLKNIFRSSIFVLFLIYIGQSILQDEHYSSRINISNAESNLSLLSWLRGFDQMYSSTIKSPIFGHGIGSTGYFDYDSDYVEVLRKAGLEDLNLKDGFSLLFRLIIEIGPLLFIVFVSYFTKKISEFRNVLINIKEQSYYNLIPSIFLFVFSTSLIIGSLIKEPNYASSLIYMGIFLFSTNLFQNKIKSNKYEKPSTFSGF